MKVLLDTVGWFSGALLLVLSGILLIPFSILWCGILLVVDACTHKTREAAGAARGTDGADEAAGQAPAASASIMILNWDGRELLARLLPSLRTAVAHHGGDHEIIVIDNGSQDDSVAFVTTEFPEVKLVRHPENRRFVRGYNDALHTATKDIIVLLNNDMVVDQGFLGPLLRGFADPRTFAVSSQIFLADPQARRVETGLTGGGLCSGILKLWHDEVPDHIEGLLPVLWAGGGSAAFDRRRLLALGGFDPLYDPFYFEDTGLSFEAWKRGWHVLMAPDSKVVHAHQASSARLAPGYVARIRRRNQHLFGWRHLTSTGNTIATSLLLPINLFRLAVASRGSSLFHRAAIEIGAVSSTVPRLPRLLAARLRNARRARRTDAEVFALAHSRHRFERLSAKPTGEKDRRLAILMLSARVPKRGVDGSWGLFELIKTLGPRHDITLFTLMDQQDDHHHTEALEPYVKRLEAHLIGRDVGNLDLHHQCPSHLRSRYSSPLLRLRLATLLRTERFDVLQADYLEMASMIQDLVADVSAIHVVHEPLFRALQLQQVEGLAARLTRWLRCAQSINFEARLYPRFRRVVCLTPDDESHLRRWSPRLLTTVNPIGADIERIQPCPPSTGQTLLSVSYFGHPPNVDAAIWFVTRVLPLVRDALPAVTIRLAGGGAPAAIGALADQPGVELLGYVADLTPEMAACAMTLAPIREGGGLRTKVLESFAYGRTVVATPLAAAGIVAQDGVHFRVATTERAFATAVIDLLRDQPLRHSMETAARRLVAQHYTNEIMATRQEAIFATVIATAQR